jgi:hypothetical protein
VDTLLCPYAAGICGIAESSGARIAIALLLVAVISLGNNALASEPGGSDATQAHFPNSKAAYSLLLNDDVAAPELIARVEAPAAAEGEVPAQEKDRTESLFSLDFPKLLLRDTWYVLSSPVRWDAQDWLKVGIGIAGVAAVSLADQSLRTQAEHLENGAAKEAASQIRLFGSDYSYATLGLFYAGGEIFNDPTAKAVFIDGAAATLVASGIITPALKYAIGRSRPRAGLGEYHFTPFSNNNASFPSGETTQAFAVASPVIRQAPVFLILIVQRRIFFLAMGFAVSARKRLMTPTRIPPLSGARRLAV